MFGGNPGANGEAGSSVAPGAGVRRLPYGARFHFRDGELPRPKMPLIPGHEIVGSLVKAGDGTMRFEAATASGLRPPSIKKPQPLTKLGLFYYKSGSVLLFHTATVQYHRRWRA